MEDLKQENIRLNSLVVALENQRNNALNTAAQFHAQFLESDAALRNTLEELEKLKAAQEKTNKSSPAKVKTN